MDRARWQNWELAGLFVTLLAGNLLHFVYGWSGQSPLAAVFAAVNESTWEHMKLLAVPWLLWSALELIVLRGDGNPMARALGLLAGLMAIPVLYYTYRGITGQNLALVNVLIFQVAVLLAYSVSCAVQERGALRGRGWRTLGLALLLAVGLLTVYWTFYPPGLPLFADPITGLRGLPVT